MARSLYFSHLFIRIGLAAVFLWFGIDKFIHPDYWLNAWVPENLIALIGAFRISANQVISISAIFEVLVGVSLLANIFIRQFSLLALIFLASIFIFFSLDGISEILIRDLGLMGGFLALMVWPDSRRVI